MSYQAYSVVGFDDKGVVIEILGIALIVAPLGLIIWILMIIDPGDLQTKNVFNWSFLFTFTTAPSWLYIGFFHQFYVQWRQDRKATTFAIEPMDTVFQSDPTIKKEFGEFAARQFITESINFIEDVNTYKRFYFEKGDSWRVAKFKTLVETYVVSGSRMEVNISYAMRNQIVKAYDQVKQGKSIKDLVNEFDAAVKEVEQMVHNGAWTEFLMVRRKRQSKTMEVVPVDGTA
jgi:hypothetical protein